MRLTLPGDATAGRQMETVFSRHKFTDSSLLAVKAVRREEVLSPYIYIGPNSCYESAPRDVCYELGRQFAERQPMLQTLRCSQDYGKNALASVIKKKSRESCQSSVFRFVFLFFLLSSFFSLTSIFVIPNPKRSRRLVGNRVIRLKSAFER